ncbi:type IV pilus biogenesis/stability protein PilW [Atopomonas sediminilitoris]|uniref:type IV pilus biogenesis/stability protein PilW n=1 Tax=Atopomonas sediminilitoris TaxID=2919919 RepID=UPI001F4EF5E1|nr:type IV pilus biogenesis/stability protein PilW [Atopomonas sediminilitoris]MCJ8169199.1 type IV pilus biogenesis/stability protein PilW [Atopomonas sediminilitoris]
MHCQRALFMMFAILLLAGCVSTTTSGMRNPLKTEEGREQAVDAYVDLGKGYLRSGTPERAKTPLKKALDIDPDNTDALEALALVFQYEQENELAEDYYRRALSTTNDPRVLYNYGGFLFEQARYAEAYKQFELASKDTLYDSRSRVFESLGITALRLNDPVKAKKFLVKSLRLNRDQPLALIELAELTYTNKDYLASRDYYAAYSDLIRQQDARSLWLGIRLARVFDDRDTAASYTLQLKRLFPASPEYQEYLKTGGQ